MGLDMIEAADACVAAISAGPIARRGSLEGRYVRRLDRSSFDGVRSRSQSPFMQAQGAAVASVQGDSSGALSTLAEPPPEEVRTTA